MRQHNVVIVLAYSGVTLHNLVVVSGDSHNTVEHLNDKQRNKEIYVLLEVEEDALIGNGKTSLHVLDKLFQNRSQTARARSYPPFPDLPLFTSQSLAQQRK